MLITTIVLVIPLAIFALMIWLEFILARKENKWLGLLLPLITLILSIVMALGEFTVSDAIARLALGNIPTVVLLIIYGVCREKRQKLSQLDKMKIHDL